MSDLKKKSLNALIWSFIGSFGVYFVKFGFTIAIARQLSPHDYAIIGMVTIFTAFGSVFVDSGLQTSLIQKKDISQADLSTVFFFNIIISILFYILMYISSNAISSFFNKESLGIIIKVISLNIFIGALSSVHLTILIKEMDFKIQAKINLFATIISGLLALFLAYKGYGVWSLIFQATSLTIIKTFLLIINTKWIPKIIFDIKSFKNLFSFGKNILLQRILGTFTKNIYYPIIGKIFPVEILGLYTRAKRFQEIIIIQFSIAFQRVIFPAFSQIQDDKERFFKNSIIGFGIIIFILVIIVSTLIITADAFVIWLLTPKWSELIPYLKILYLEGLFYPLYVFNRSLLNSLGQSKSTLVLDIITKIIIFLSIPIGIYFGIFGLLISIVFSSSLGFLISIYFLGKYNKKYIKEEIKLFILPVGIGLVLFSFLYIFIPIIDVNYMSLVLSIINFIVYYYLAKLMGIKSYKYLKELIINKISNKIISRLL